MSFLFIFSAVLLLCCLIGFFLGLMRGWKRSLVRFCVVLLSAILAFVFATSFSASVMNTPLSEAPDMVEEIFSSAPIEGDMPIKEAVLLVIGEDESIGQLLAATPTLTNFIAGIPEALLSIILFVPLFFIIKFLLWFPSAIMTAIFLRKKNRRLVGGAIGALQGVLCACVILVPVFGCMTTLDAAINAIPTETENTIYTEVQALNEQYYQPLKSDPAYGVMKALGIKSLCNGVFNGLATVKNTDGSKTKVFDDLNKSLPAVVQLARFEELNTEDLGEKDVELLRSLSVTIGDAPLFINTASELLSNLANTLLDGRSFMGIEPPAPDADPHTAAMLHDTLVTLADVNAESLKTNLPQFVDLFGVLVEYDVMDTLSEEDADILTLLANENFTTDFLTAMTKSDILSPIAVSAVNHVGINLIAETLGIPDDDAAVYDEMVDALVTELGTHHGLQGGIAFMSTTATMSERDEAIEAVSHILIHYTKNLSEEDAKVVATDLINAFCVTGATNASPNAVRTKLAEEPCAAVKASSFDSALVVRADLISADIDVFKNMTAEERDAEVANFSRIVHTASDMMVNLDGGFSDLSSQLNMLPSIGKMLNAMDDSVLLGNSTEGMLTHFLEMDEVKEVIAEKALNTLNNKISEGTVNYEATFSSISAAYRMAHSLSNKTPEPEMPDDNPDDTPSDTPSDTPNEAAEELVSAVEDLFQSMDETSAEIIKDAVDDKFLSDMGVPEEVAESAQVIVSTFFDEIVKNSENENIDYEQESKAVETIVDIVVSTGSNETKVEDIINDETLDSIVSSETISGTLITIAQDENVNLDIHEKINEESREAINDAISNFENGKELDEKTAACLDALRDLLGIGK